MFTVFLYILALGFLAFSAIKDPKKTRLALNKSLRSFLNILPDFATILALIGVMLTFLSPQIIATLLGKGSGFLGMFLSSVVGSITLIPGFVAFPLVKSLLDMGAGIMQMAVFVSTLMMVGFVTAPLEIKYFGKRETILRNSLSYIFSFIVAIVVGLVVGG
ncbi:MAG: hypothetical protein PWP65_1570 [Clostridia bacterium]|nr:hypothetical protein [Clostridia bacterium]